jgi:hypothetical protein
MLRPATGSLNIGLDGKISASKINLWTAGLLREKGCSVVIGGANGNGRHAASC